MRIYFEQTVKCPDGGEQLSDKADKCVQSSADSTVEDEQVRKNADMKKTRDDIDYAEQFLVDKPHYEREKKKLENAEAVYIKIRNAIWWIWELLVCGVGYLILRDGQSFGTVSVSVMFGTAMLAAVIVLNAWFEYYPSYMYIKNCMVWMKSNNYDLYDYINIQYAACINSGNLDVLESLLNFTSAYYYMMNGDKFRAYKRHLIIRAVICIAIAVWLVLGLPFVIGCGVMTGFDTAVLLGAIIPTATLFVVYFVTYFCLTGRDYKLVRSVYKDIK